MADNIIPRILDIGIAPVAFLLMLVVGLALEWPVFSASLRPIHRLAADFMMAVVLPPAAALIAVLVLSPSAETAIAILLLAACPVGDIANAYTLMAKGSVARSLSLNALTVIAAPVSMLVMFSIYPVFGFELPPLLAPTRELALRLLVFLLLPVSLGMLIRHRSPKTAARTLPAITGVTTVCVLLLLALVLANPGSRPPNIPETLAVSAAFIAISSALGGAFLPFLRRRPGERTALALCLPVRNVGITALIAIQVLGETHIVSAAAVYFSLEVAVLLPAAVLLGRRARSAASS